MGRAQIAILLEYGREQGIAVDQCCRSSTRLTVENWSRVDPSKAQEAQVIQNCCVKWTFTLSARCPDRAERCDLITFGLHGRAMMASPRLPRWRGWLPVIWGRNLHFNRIRFRHKSDAVYTVFGTRRLLS